MAPTLQNSAKIDLERLWVVLAEARERSSSPGRSAVDLPPPWESEDEAVRAAWTRITDPCRLEELETRARRVLNPLAVEYTHRALEACRRRASQPDGPKVGSPWWVVLLVGRRPWRTLGRIVILVVASFVLFKYILIPIRVKGHSMEPSYRDGAVTLINRLSYSWSTPRRGHVVAVIMAGKKFMYLKRIIALPGETISIHRGIVAINGSPLAEPYLRQRAPWSLDSTQLKSDEYFVIGDNRTMDQDEHEFGSVVEVGVVGRALF